MVVNIHTWKDKNAWFASYCTGIESDMEQGTDRADALENLYTTVVVERPNDYNTILDCIQRELDNAYSGE